MPRHLPALPLALLLLASPLWGQGGEGGVPRPPTAEELAALPADTRLRQQTALKAVWMERLIRARDERHRISRQNAAACVLLAQKLGAPAAFVSMLRLQSAGNLSPRQRHELDSAQLALLTAYAVDAREMRFFVEESPLSAEQLRDVAAWLPLEPHFNTPPAEEDTPVTAQQAARAYGEYLAGRRALADALQPVADRATADAAADALLPLVPGQQAAQRILLLTPPELQSSARVPYLLEDTAANTAAARALERMESAACFGSHRLQTLLLLMR